MTIYVNTKKDFPNKDHWVILTFKSWWVDGDERSRKNPGHGYPGHNETGVDYQAYETEAEWEKEVINLVENKHKFSDNDNFVAFKASKPIKTKTTVEIEK